jgi:hypothetical protein
MEDEDGHGAQARRSSGSNRRARQLERYYRRCLQARLYKIENRSLETLEKQRNKAPVEAFERVRVPVSRGFNFKHQPKSAIDQSIQDERRRLVSVRVLSVVLPVAS